ncbi:MAG: molybdopterin-binding protein [Thermoproteus sp.]
MYALVRLRGYIEDVGFRAVVSSDVAQALGLKVGDAVKLESPDGASGARIARVDGSMKSGIAVTSDIYMALGGRSRAVLLKKVERSFEATAVRLGVVADTPLTLEELKGALSAVASARVPVFSNFVGFLYTPKGWVKVVVKRVEPREPAYISTETAAQLG